MKISTLLQNNRVQKWAAVLSAIVVWQLAATLVGTSVILVSPVDVGRRLCELILQPSFWVTILHSFSGIVGGFFGGFVLGTALAFAAGRYRAVKALLFPYMLTIKSVPVVSFIILAFWVLSADTLSYAIAFLMVLPVVYTNVLDGVENIDESLLEMAKVFKIPYIKRFLYIVLPSVKPFVLSAISVSAGLAWKSGVAAEVICNPLGSIGERLYYAKVHLETADLFAWTLVIVLLSILFEKLFSLLVKSLYRLIR